MIYKEGPCDALLFRKTYTVADANRRRVHNNFSIEQNPTDTEPKERMRASHVTQSTYTRALAPVSVRRTSIFVAEFVPLLLIMLIPVSVNAGVFGALAALFAEDVVATSTVAYVDIDHSARFTPLLSARVNPDPLSIGGGDITVANGALLATGPVGAEEIAASPNKSGEISVYVVREGDALSQIADMYGVTTNTILWANDLSRASDIQPGETLVILPIAGVQHTVTKGETLSSILKKYGANEAEVLEYNNMTADQALAVGDEIMIPGGDLHAPAAKTVAAAAPTKSTGSKGGSGWLSHPAPGAVRSQGLHGYNGVDLAGGSGSTIRAAAAGEVIVAKAAGWNGGYGNYIVIRHGNGVQTLYAHLSSVSIAPGDYVAQGQTIGGMGNTGKSTGTHLHFEVRGGSNPF